MNNFDTAIVETNNFAAFLPAPEARKTTVVPANMMAYTQIAPAPNSTAQPAVHTTGNIGNILGQLNSQRENWEASAYKTSNQMLYAILQQCYQLERSMQRSQYSELNDYCKQRGIGYNSSTDTIAKIIKCVFPVDRRRVSTYVTALRAAMQHDVEIQNLADWLERNGGVQEINLRRSANYKTDTERAAEAKQVVMHQPVLATVTSVELTALYSLKSSEDTVLLLASHNANGQFEIRQLIQTESAIKAVLSSYYPKAVEKKQAQDTVQTAASQQQQTLDTLNSVASHISAKAA